MIDTRQMATTQRPGQGRWRFDVTDYVRLHEAGLIPEDARTELVEGEIRIMAPIGPEHGSSQATLTMLLAQRLGSQGLIWPQNSLQLGRKTLLQPDLAILRPDPDNYFHRHPTAADVLLLVEVAQSSLRYDRTRKVPLYARHGVPEVWIVDVAGSALEVYRAPHDGQYARIERLTAPATVAPVALPDVVLELGDIVRRRATA